MNNEIDEWMERLSRGTKFHIGVIKAMWDSLGDIEPPHKKSILDRKSLIHATLTSLTSDKIHVLKLLGLYVQVGGSANT